LKAKKGYGQNEKAQGAAGAMEALSVACHAPSVKRLEEVTEAQGIFFRVVPYQIKIFPILAL
jgi:hypothetical protein